MYLNKQLYILILLVSASFQGHGQRMRYDKNKSLHLRLSDNQLLLKNSDRWLILNVSIQNKSDSSFILYDFNIIGPRTLELNDFEILILWQEMSCSFLMLMGNLC